MNVTGEIFNARVPEDITAISDVLVPLPSLGYSGGSENRYFFDLWMPFNLAGVVSGYQFDIPAGSAIMCQATVFDTVGGIPTTTLSFANPFNIAGGVGLSGDFVLWVRGMATGSLAISFAQAVTDGGNPITVYGNCFLQILKTA